MHHRGWTVSPGQNTHFCSLAEPQRYQLHVATISQATDPSPFHTFNYCQSNSLATNTPADEVLLPFSWGSAAEHHREIGGISIFSYFGVPVTTGKNKLFSANIFIHFSSKIEVNIKG